jgi:ABC-type phosphate/phosphonate transport system substrate-binding protein
MRHMRGWSRPMLAVLFLLVYSGSPIAAEDGEEGGELPLHDMAAVTASLGNVNPNDAVAAFETYAKIYARAKGVSTRIEATVFDNLAALRQEMVQGRFKIVGLQIQDYFELRQDVALDPLFVAERSGTKMESYVLLVHVDAGVSELAQLGGKELLTYTNTQMGIANIWLDGVLLEAGLPEARSFFHTVKIHSKISSALLPVFFQQADVCLVSRSGFETMVELNPQLGQRLQVLASSPELVPFVTCLRSDFTGSSRRDTESAYEEAHLHPAGQQALLLFGFDRMLRCTPEDLESAWEVLNKYKKLKGSVDGKRGNEL